MVTPLVLGLLFGTGVVVTARGLAPQRPALIDALRVLDAAPSGAMTAASSDRGLATSVVGRAARRATQVAGTDLGTLNADLRLVGRSMERHALDKLLVCGVFFLLPPLVAGLMLAAGQAPLWGLVVLGSGALGAAGFVVPDLNVRSEAERRRREFRHALAAYLDLVVIVVAGGGGTETALHDAAEAGSGWAFAEIRRALAASRLAGTTPWSALRQLGDDLGVRELGELAAGVSLAGERGARVRASLTAKAVSMREHQLAEAETAAQEATEKMSVPVVLLLFGFLAFVLYPALQFVLEGL